MISEHSHKHTFAMILIAIGFLLALTSHILVGALCFLVGLAIDHTCDYIYYKKRKKILQLQIERKKYKFNNVKSYVYLDNELHLELETGEKHTFNVDKFSKKEITNLLA